jgi:hypothetical protein
MEGPSILVHQALHGYDDGHRLLKMSLDLPNDAKREMLVLSDLSGQRRPEGFESYVTGYGLPESNLYALAKTWLAPEMKRPGCVWTHTLLLDFADLSQLESLQQIEHLTALWTRPDDKLNRTFYGKTLGFTFGSIPSPPLEDSAQVVRRTGPEKVSAILNSLYERPNAPVFVAADDSEQLKGFIYLLWLQQWPRLRRAFSFCTGVTSCRRLRGEPLDLQIAPSSAFSSLVREVPGGSFVNGRESTSGGKNSQLTEQKEESNQSPLWINRAVADLIAPSPSLRQFLRLFGAESQKPRGGFAALLDIFDHIQAINSGRGYDGKRGVDIEEEEDPLETLLETVANRFPSSKHGARLKLATFGTPLPNQVLNISEERMLQGLASTSHYEALDKKSLAIRERATSLWHRHPDRAEQLLLHLTQDGLSPLVEDVLAGVADAVNAHDALNLFRHNPSLASSFVQRNPSLTTSPSLWTGPVNLQRELFDALERHSLTEEERSVIAGAVFAADAQELAVQVIERLGESGARGVLTQLEAAPRELTASWRHALAQRPEVLARWLEECLVQEQGRQKRIEAALQIMGLLHPRSAQVQSIKPDFWLAFSEAVAPQLVRPTPEAKRMRLSSKAAFFLMAVGMENADGRGDQLIERFFEVVHEDLATNSFDYSAWKWLEEITPLLPFNDWDKCERLRRAVIERFARFGWPLRSLTGAIQHQSTLEFMVRSCSQTEEGQRILKGLKRLVASKEMVVPQWQVDILLKRRKKRWFRIG